MVPTWLGEQDTNGVPGQSAVFPRHDVPLAGIPVRRRRSMASAPRCASVGAEDQGDRQQERDAEVVESQDVFRLSSEAISRWLPSDMDDFMIAWMATPKPPHPEEDKPHWDEEKSLLSLRSRRGSCR